MGVCEVSARCLRYSGSGCVGYVLCERHQARPPPTNYVTKRRGTIDEVRATSSCVRIFGSTCLARRTTLGFLCLAAGPHLA